MATLPESARAVLESAALAHLVTLNEDGSPQVSIVWVGLDGDEIVAGHLPEHKKVRNIRDDSRVALSVETSNHNPIGLTEYLVVYGTARITEGGAPELLQRLARTYLGPDVRFPPMDNPPPGYITHITVDRISGPAPGRKADSADHARYRPDQAAGATLTSRVTVSAAGSLSAGSPSSANAIADKHSCSASARVANPE